MKTAFNKFKFKDRATVVNGPASFSSDISELGLETALNPDKPNENTVVFLYSKEELLDFLENSLSLILPDSVLWLAYQKGTSKIKTDLNRDIIREIAGLYGIKTVTAISIDDIWSALRFRPLERVGK